MADAHSGSNSDFMPGRLQDSCNAVYMCRQQLQQSESFSPRVDAHSRRLAESVYEQTRGLGPTALQGRLNYLHQLGKLTLRDRKSSLMSLPQQREDIEFAVNYQILFAPQAMTRRLNCTD